MSELHKLLGCLREQWFSVFKSPFKSHLKINLQESVFYIS
jgi:hypothetical protein